MMRDSIRLWIKDASIRAHDDMIVLAGFRVPIPKPRGWSDADWAEPYDDAKYDRPGADWDTSWDRVLVCERGEWRKERLPVECHAIRDGVLLSQNGIVVPAWKEERIEHPRKMPIVDIALRNGEMLGVTGFVARDQVCAIARGRCTPLALKTVQARVRCIRVLSDGRIVVAGEGIFISNGDGWSRLREHKGDPICCLAIGPGDELLAGTVGGSVIVQGKLFDPLARGPILSVVRHRGMIFASTATTVARHAPKGFVAIDVPSPPHRVGPTYGKLFALGDRLWLAGTHGIQWSDDGAAWTSVSFQ